MIEFTYLHYLFLHFYDQFHRVNKNKSNMNTKVHNLVFMIIHHMKNMYVSLKGEHYLFFFFKSLPRGEQFQCDTGKLSVNSEKNRVYSTLPCRLYVFFIFYITDMSDLNLG